MKVFLQALLLSALVPKHCYQASAENKIEHERIRSEILKDEVLVALNDETIAETTTITTPTTEPPVVPVELSIAVSPTSVAYGGGFEVTVSNPDAKTSNKVKIFNRDDSRMRSAGLLSASAKEETQTIGFSITGPDVSSTKKLPLHPGDYKACLVDNVSDIICADFNVNPISPNLLLGTKLRANPAYGYGRNLPVRFTSLAPLPVNAWIGIFEAETPPPNKVENRGLDWVYAGCNNDYGNQRKQGACSIRKVVGLVNGFRRDIPVGRYRFCLNFYTNKPYKNTICSEPFRIKAPKLEVALEIPYGSNISVKFQNQFATKFNWLALYDNKKKEELWSSMCGSKRNWNKSSCPEKKQGTVIFSGADPDQESHERWPILPGKKTVCMYGTRDGKGRLALVCQEFTVKPIPLSVISDTSVSTSATHYSYKETIFANFDTPTAYPSTWIAIYKADAILSGMSRLPDNPIDWKYSSCNNQQGDQRESHNCQKKKTSGKVKFEKDIRPGSYKICFSFYHNSPYTKFTCSDSFMVKEPECEDDLTYKFKLFDGKTEVDCAWIDEAGISPGQRANRLSKWCTGVASKADKCKASCGKCICEDDPDYTFKLLDGSTEVSCAWIDEFGIGPNQRANRLAKWCTGPNSKANTCKASCDKCVCKDTDNYAWTIFDGSMQSCGFITGGDALQNSKRAARWCDPTKGDNKLSHCKSSCGRCN